LQLSGAAAAGWRSQTAGRVGRADAEDAIYVLAEHGCHR
jgi:hypothetical protein